MSSSLVSTSRWLLSAFAVCAVAATSLGCGGSEDPAFSKPAGSNPGTDPGGSTTGGGSATGGGSTTGGTTTPPAGDGGTTPTGGTVGGGIGCNTTPTRYVVLGHSVAHCFQVGGIDSQTCAFKSTQGVLAKRFPNLTYENYAVDGAVISGVVKTQLPKITPGPGHIFVNLMIGGNDLAAHLYEPDATARASWEKLKPQAITDYESIMSYFDDKTKFPDGATILVNTQYNPFDECVAGQYSFATLAKQAIIGEFNTVLAGIVANHKNAALVDQLTTFEGHGHNYNQSQCPRYVAGYAGWMADLIHPNADGHANLAKEMSSTIDAIYTCK